MLAHEFVALSDDFSRRYRAAVPPAPQLDRCDLHTLVVDRAHPRLNDRVAELDDRHDLGNRLFRMLVNRGPPPGDRDLMAPGHCPRSGLLDMWPDDPREPLRAFVL
ncbi:hypothetical protein DEH18_34570 [Streptomyces sp. NHF165]|uniref:hypothetical protein n=1 Tax=Streptomyces sp. NHF165 TaxID=2175864 RepID=UPI00132EB382|nr:hypothetical protein [Streptomyces sp. NHF165]QHF98108.1 hypothetical protein DEH18_34570 [Streptomyces sp. NHF165]